MEDIQRALGLPVSYTQEDVRGIPNIIRETYSLQVVLIDQVKVLMMTPKSHVKPVESIKKHIQVLQKKVDMPVVLRVDSLTSYMREKLIASGVPFIVWQKQIYLPFLGIYLQQRTDEDKHGAASLSPASQLLLFYLIYMRSEEVPTRKAGEDLGLSAMSISRAVRELSSHDLISVRKAGNRRFLYSSKSKQDLYEAAKPYLSNPVKKQCYIDRHELTDEMPAAGDEALADYSILGYPRIPVRAVYRIGGLKTLSKDLLTSSAEQAVLQHWRYDPGVLRYDKAKNTVDPLSLSLSLKDEKDERIQQAVEEMLKKLWEDLDGKRY